VLVRELAEWQPDQYARVTCWPLREALLAFEQRMKRHAHDDYRADLLVHAVMAPYLSKNATPPDIPPILR